MTTWEKRIIAAFIERYPGSAAAALAATTGKTAVEDGASAVTAEDGVTAEAALSGGGEAPAEASPPVKEPRPLRLKPDRIVPGIDRASPDDRESFLEAAETLEGRGLLSLIWVRHRKGETLSALVCRDPELLYELAGEESPKTTAEKVRSAARSFAAGTVSEEGAMFSFLAENFSPLDAAGGIDVTAVTDLARLTRFLFDQDEPEQGRIRGITTRALSTALYGDSKRLETLMTLFKPLFVRAKRRGISIPDFSFLDRSFPETFIAGKIIFDFKEDEPPPENAAGEVYRVENGEMIRPTENAAGNLRPCGLTPLVNAGGNILGLPLETILKIRRIRPLEGAVPVGVSARALMIENKETFFALAQALPAGPSALPAALPAALPGYDCFLYTGGHPNRAVRALASLLAESGFAFSHAGDLDPDGILILQELAEITGKEVKPLRMDAAAFDAYLECGRKLEPSMHKRTALISEKTRAIPGMAELIDRIEETGMGVEQEIIDYRE
jgi:hypothetical protein